MLTPNPIYIDIETNVFLDVLDTVHCLGLAEGDAPAELIVGHQSVAKRVSSWASRKASGKVTLVAHNGIAFDIPVLAKVFGFAEADITIVDTLVLARLVFPDMSPDDDKLVLRGELPAPHGLTLP